MQSKAILLGKINFPRPTGTRIQMMPIDIHTMDGGELLRPWEDTARRIVKAFPLDKLTEDCGTIGYITIDELRMDAGQRQRRSGLRVDGWAEDGQEVTSHGGGGGGGTILNNKFGMLIANNMDDTCRVYVGNLPDTPKHDGDCEHMRDQLHTMQQIDMKANEIWWVNGLCLHETMPQKTAGVRQFFRMTMPNKGDWYSEYTENPVGVKAPGNILGPRMQLTENLPEWKKA